MNEWRSDRRRWLLTLLVACLLLAGPVSAQEEDGDQVEGFDAPGQFTVLLGSGAAQRDASVYIPQGFEPDGGPYPLVLVFHGAGSSGPGIAAYSEFNRLADEEGIIVAYPSGINNAWNVGIPDRRVQGVDDVTFARALIEFMDRNAPIDPARIYATGHSMGGMMSFRLGCSLPDQIAAVASVASTFPGDLLNFCLFADPVPVMVIQGTEDTVLPYEGMRDAEGRRLMLSADETLRYWADQNDCPSGYTYRSLPDANPADSTRVQRRSYSECAGDSEVILYTVEGGGHTWPGHFIGTALDLGQTSMDFDATAAIWEFFERHTNG